MTKTFQVETLKKMVNESLKGSTCSADIRKGQMAMLEQVLHDSKNYKGFRYLLAIEVPKGQIPGMHVHGTIENTPYEARFKNTDPSRVEYF